ncbi:MAG: ATP-binding cassette domain-containing protein [Candidatus Poseidoniales archaeon]|jgi:ABC-2 type transport system ATP-binding protein|tara:strand:+ start:1768 stop:2766 length:999 start_codon:yes stop_codon:yes gene_type:complete
MSEDINQEWAIETKNLCKMYGPHLALDDVNLRIPKGAVGVLGPNGAGKSTLFKCILGLIQITSGSGSVLGFDIRTEGNLIRSKIGYMPEYDALDPGLSAIDQVRYSGEILGMNTDIATQRAHEVLEYVGLKEQRYRKIDTFSSGMKQATKLACALIHDPEILICDEPTNGLDKRARKFMLNTLRRTAEEGGRTVLLSSHVMEDVQEVCDSILMIYKGKVVLQKSIDELVEQVDSEIELTIWGGASNMEIQLIKKGYNVRRLGRILRVTLIDEDTISGILKVAAECGVQVRQLKEYKPDLEDIFLLIMDKLGEEIKVTSDLMTAEHSGGVSNA